MSHRFQILFRLCGRDLPDIFDQQGALYRCYTRTEWHDPTANEYNAWETTKSRGNSKKGWTQVNDCKRYPTNWTRYLTELTKQSDVIYTIFNNWSIFIVVPQIPQQPEPQAGERSKPCCKTCKRPMKGHNKFLDCPRNQK